MVAHGWIAPGANVALSGKVTPNIGGIPKVRIGYALINRDTEKELTGKTIDYTPVSGAPLSLSLQIAIPPNATQGRYRAELRVSSVDGNVVYWKEPRAVCFTVTTQPPPSDGALIPLRGCAELPFSKSDAAMNYVYASGSQIVDSAGTPLRISALNWLGTEGSAGWASNGLWIVSYKRMLEAIKSEGFNAVRIPWTDSILYARPNPDPSAGFLDSRGAPGAPPYNADLHDPAFPQPGRDGFYKFKKTIDIFQAYADYAAQIGLKIFFEHHSNRGSAGQQRNGLWIAKDLSRNYCSDGQFVPEFDVIKGKTPSNPDDWSNLAKLYPNFGKCDTPDSSPSKFTDYATFKKNWVDLAARFNNHPAVVGFELHNEPASAWPCDATPWIWCSPARLNWGVSRDQYDIKWMAEDVGNAIHQVNPNALVILEAPFTGYNGAPVPAWAQRPKPPGTDPKGSAQDGDLTAVASYRNNPVILQRPHKFSYSVHIYPFDVVGDYQGKDDGKGSSANYSASYWGPEFGYVVARNIAPVIVTEMAACISAGKTRQDAKNYLEGVMPFLNGQAGSTGGDSLYANRQPMNATWIGAGLGASAAGISDCTDPADRNPNGMLWDWPNPNKKEERNRIPFKYNRPETLAQTDKLLFHGTGDVSPDNSVVGVGGSIVDPGRNVWAVRDGKVTFNGAVDVTTADAATVAYASSKVCYRKTFGAWFCKGRSGWVASASPLRTSPNGFVSTPGGPLLIDAAGNFWNLGFGRVMVNGTVDDTTDKVAQLANFGGRIWQMNASGNWYSKAGPTAAWVAAASNPLPPSAASKIVTEGGGAIIDANRNSWSIVDGRIIVNGSFDKTTDRVIELAYFGGKIWQKNADWLWWSKAKPAEAWGPVGGQTAGPWIPASANGTTVASGGGAIVSSAGSRNWTISNGKVVVDGVVDDTTENVVKLAYQRGKVWQQNSDGLWWSKANYFDAWGPPGGTATAPF